MFLHDGCCSLPIEIYRRIKPNGACVVAGVIGRRLAVGQAIAHGPNAVGGRVKGIAQTALEHRIVTRGKKDHRADDRGRQQDILHRALTFCLHFPEHRNAS